MHKAILLTVAALLLIVGTVQPAAAQERQLSERAVEREFQERHEELGEDDLESRYALALWAFEQYNAKRLNVRALELAESELQAILEQDPDHENAIVLMRVVQDRLETAQAARTPDFAAMAFLAIGGLGIFLLGMKNMSEGMQAVAGDRLRRMISAVTDNRLLATGIGTTVTCVVQSSSITTVIVVGLVNSGMMVLHQAIGVIMGANIGTTITGWILVLKIGKYGLPILGVAAFIWLFARNDRLRYIALTGMGLGMIFFGLELMKDGFEPMRYVPQFEEAFAWFAADTYFGVLRAALIGCLLTFIVQSSSATLGITIGLAATGVIEFQTAAALVLGENVGTTITAWLASLGANTSAKRAAYAHILFNLFGVLWITAIFQIYIQVIDQIIFWADGYRPLLVDIADFSEEAEYAAIVTAGIAATHTGFNVANTLIFLPFVRKFAQFLEWLVPDRGVKEISHLAHMDARLIESPMIAIEQSRRQVLKMSEGVLKMLTWVREMLNQDKPDEKLVKKLFHREQIMDNVQQEVIDFVTDLLAGEVPHSVTVEAREQLRMADEYESVSDYVSTVLKSHLRMRNADLKLTQEEHETIMELHDRVVQYVELVTSSVKSNNGHVLGRAETESEMITHRIKEMREQHLVRLTEDKIDPVHSMSYMAMLNAYRKIKDHALNIAEAAAGHK